jgi:hypothetical protein
MIAMETLEEPTARECYLSPAVAQPSPNAGKSPLMCILLGDRPATSPQGLPRSPQYGSDILRGEGRTLRSWADFEGIPLTQAKVH